LGGQRGGVERAEREPVAEFARFLAWGHFNRVAHLLTRKVTIQVGGQNRRFIYKRDTSTYAQGTDPTVAYGA